MFFLHILKVSIIIAIASSGSTHDNRISSALYAVAVKFWGIPVEKNERKTHKNLVICGLDRIWYTHHAIKKVNFKFDTP